MPDRLCSLVLAAHGSLDSENSNQPLHDLAQSIADSPQFAAGKFQAVRPAFLNGQPQMTHVLDTLPPGDVVIVPVMTSEGYYLKKLPAKFAENRNADQFRIFMTPVLGVHPSIPERVSHRISRLLNKYELPISETTVVIVGHGTRRNSTSGQSTIDLTQTLTTQFSGLKFETAFLDQDPTADQVAANIRTRHTLVIPFLISRGPHTTQDVPRAFGLPAGPDIQFPLVQHNENGSCICDLPVGMYPDWATICLQLAQKTISGSEPIRLSSVGEPTT